MELASLSFEDVMKVTSQISSSVSLSDVEAKALYDYLCRVPSGGIVVEIGCQLGRSSSIIAQLQPLMGYHAIYIDPYTDQPEMLQGWTEMMMRIGDRQNHEFTLLCMRTEQAEWILDRIGEFTLALIDGDHEFESVFVDCLHVGDRIRRGGLLLAHDYDRPSLPGVKAAIDTYMDMSWHRLGVYGSLGVWLKK